MTEQLIGYRVLIAEDERLTSLYYAHPWMVENEARCRRVGGWLTDVLSRPHAEAAPGSHCTCGLYAYHELARARSEADRRADAVIALVTASGDVCVHPDGFRAQHLRIHALADATGSAALAARALDLPRVASDVLRVLGAEHGRGGARLAPERRRAVGSGFNPTGRAMLAAIALCALGLVVLPGLAASTPVLVGGWALFALVAAGLAQEVRCHWLAGREVWRRRRVHEPDASLLRGLRDELATRWASSPERARREGGSRRPRRAPRPR